MTSWIHKDDHRWQARSQIELVSAAADPDKLGVGSTPWLGDYASTGLLVPSALTVDQAHRYLFRFCGIQIPSGRGLLLKGVRQAATIRNVQRDEDDVIVFVAEKEITSPFWSFMNGNISWHLRFQADQQIASRYDAAQLPGTAPANIGLDSALLYNIIAPYEPPGAGIPPGRDVEHLGTWRDMRFPWATTSWDMCVPVMGPGLLVYYCSVHQTRPGIRGVQDPSDDPGGLRPEDRFVLQYPNAIYGHVAGALSVELLPSGLKEIGR